MLELRTEARFSAGCHRLHMNRSDPKPLDAVWHLDCKLQKHRARSLSPDRSHNEVDGIFFLAGIMQLDHYVQADKVTAIDKVFRV